ncbi:MAG TPA: hypothetical protein VHK69_14175 [Chitinophagaceae bacterium]|jgi:hypothetical protein|nr:hypothetical protein [Chitinophagaceae bacterium]
MGKRLSFMVALLTTAPVFFACHSGKKAQVVTSAPQTGERPASLCDRKIQYRISSIRKTKTLEEIDRPVVLTINPAAKLMTFTEASSANEAQRKEKVMEVVDCSLQEGSNEGFALYKTTFMGPDNERVEELWRLEVKGGGTTIYYSVKGTERTTFRVADANILK